MKEQKKIGLLTFHCAQNYGAVLQCYATVCFLKKHNYDIETIDYQNQALKQRYKKQNFSFYFNPKNIYRSFKYNSHFVPNKTFGEFVKKNLNLSNQKYDELNIFIANNVYTTFIVGSDQVWNMSLNGDDNNYFLNFVKEEKQKIGLSVSCGGKAKLFNKALISSLSTFKSISIRENDDFLELKKQLPSSFNIQNTLDPVFLLSKDEWLEIEECPHEQNEPYIFIYMVFEDKELIRYVKKHYKSQKILYVNQGKINVPGVKNLRNVSPQRFISLINNADIVFTNSFHGLAFSLIFNKKFGVKLLEKNTTINNRVISLLDLIEGKDHLIEPKNKEICVDSIDNRYESEKNKLINYLLNSLE